MKSLSHMVCVAAFAVSACSADERTLELEQPVIPTVFFSDSEGLPLSMSSDDDTYVHKVTPDGPAALHDPNGERLMWGEFKGASGEAYVSCGDDGTAIDIDARGLVPNGVYTGWLAFFDEPGFGAAGLSAISAISAMGSPDGAMSRFVAGPDGRGTLETFNRAAKAGIALAHEVQMPTCLLDTYEVHLVLAYHQDGNTCGDNPCAADTVAEHVAWVIVAGEGQ